MSKGPWKKRTKGSGIHYWKEGDVEDKAGLKAIHHWVKYRKPKPEFCESCGKNPPKDCANIRNHNYTRNLEDYAWLCQSCHQKWDQEHGTNRGPKKGFKQNFSEEFRQKLREKGKILGLTYGPLNKKL